MAQFQAKRGSLLERDKSDPLTARLGILVMRLTVDNNSSLLPIYFPSLEKRQTDFGAMRHWSVEPLVIHRLFAKDSSELYAVLWTDTSEVVH